MTETWFTKGDKLLKKQLEEIELENGLKFLRKDRNSRGGGVALAFNQNVASFSKLKLKSLVGSKFEILPVEGKIKGFKKQHVVFCCYLPPSLTAADSGAFMDRLTDAVSEARSKKTDSWITIGGDWNGRCLEPILQIFPDIQITQSGPTRNDATLDILLTNYSQLHESVTVNAPLESELGTVSDHGILDVRSLLSRPQSYVWEVHEYLKVTKEGSDKLVERLNNMDWEQVESLAPNNSAMALKFHEVVNALLLECFKWKKVRRKSSDKPWLTDGLRKSIKRRAAIFREAGR